MTQLRLPGPIKFSSVPEIDKTAMDWAQLVLDILQKWGNGNIDGSNITTNSIPVADLLAAAWTSYTPTWTAGGGAPSLGNGTLTGRYIKLSSLVHVHVELTAGTTTNFGTGNWLFTLPFNMTAFGFSGIGMASDVSASAFYPVIPFYNSSSSVLLVTTASPGLAVSAGVPVTWATGDVIRFDHIYESA